MHRSAICLALVACFSAVSGWADTPAPKAPAFTLRDPSDRPYSLADFKDKKAIVVVFVGTECPVNNAYMPRLVELHRSYSPRDVAFLAVNANCHDTPTKIKAHAEEYRLPFPVLRDAANVVADQFHAERTPEAFVIDPSGTIVYRGRIDDQFGVGFKRPAPTRRDLAEALDEVLAGKAVSRPKTKAPGCIIARATKANLAGRITYTKDVAPVVQKHCQECHRPGQIGPMPLRTYEDALAWSEMIREVVAERRMPPWHADPGCGKFSNDRSLSAEERDTILGWVDQGCPPGDPKDSPPPRTFATGWTIGKPDVILTMKETVKVPADAGPDGIAYRYFTVPTGFKEDRWIQAAEAKPGNPSLVHHILVYILYPGFKDDVKHADGIGRGLLVAFAPGDLPAVFPEGAAKKIPKGSMLLFQMHYTPNGVAGTDESSVGLIFAKKPPKRELHTRAISQKWFAIPPNADNHEVKSVRKFDQAVEVYSLFPHMHLRGKDFSFRAVYPDGRTEKLLSVPRYDFNWQSNYRLARPLALPAGSRIECTAHFDNSDRNLNNPDPKKMVFWGEQTWEEMMIGFVDYATVESKK
jgi:peroxiredoxin